MYNLQKKLLIEFSTLSEYVLKNSVLLIRMINGINLAEVNS